MPRYYFFAQYSKHFLVVVFSIFIFHKAIGQSAIIQGVVTEKKTGQAIPGALIYNTEQPGSGTQTDANGHYRLEVSPGTIILGAKSIGYEIQKSAPFSVTTGQTLTVNFQLSEKIMQLGTFVTSASRYEQEIERISSTIDVLKPRLIENKNTTDMKDALQQMPGVSIINNEPQIRSGSGFSFGAGSRVLVMVDDMPLLAGDAGRPSWGFLPVENIEQVEVVKGAASVLYGSAALSGVIHVRTAYPRDTPQTRINTFTGLYNNPRNKAAIYWGKDNPGFSGMNFFHSRKIGRTDFVIGGNVFRDEGYKGSVPVNPKEPGYNPFAPNSGEFENRARLNFNLRQQSNKVQGLSYGLNGNVMLSRLNQTLLWFNADSGMYRAYPGAMTYTEQSTAYIDPWVSYTGTGGWRHQLRNRYYYLYNNNDNNQGNKSHLFYNEYQVQKFFGETDKPWLQLTGGIVSTYTYGISKIFKGSLNPDSTKNAISEAQNLAGYIQLEKSFFDKRLTLSAGGRLEYFSITRPRYNKADKAAKDQETKPVFRAGANLKLSKSTFFKASFGQGFRFPTMAEKYVRTQSGPIRIYPNDSLKSESSWNAEAGIKQLFKIGGFIGYIDLNGFIQQYDNNIEFNFGQFGSFADPLFGIGFSSINIGKTRVSGWEATLAGQGKIKGFDIQALAGYTYTLPVALEPNTPYQVKAPDGLKKLTYNRSGSDTTDNQLKYRFRHLFRGDVEVSKGKLSIGFSVRYNSFMANIDKVFLDLDKLLPLVDMPVPGLTKFRETHNKGIWIADFRIHVKVSPTVRIGFVVNNLFNQEYSLRPLIIESPRTTALQLGISF